MTQDAVGPEWFASLYTRLQDAAPGGVSVLPTPFDVPQLRVERGSLRQVCRALQEAGFTVCLDVGGVDYLTLGRKPRYEVVYHFLALDPEPRRLRLRVPVPDEDPRVDTISDLWPAATAAEREVYDLFGIEFDGHPGLDRILMPADWEGFPLRRDYPLRGPRALDEERSRPAGERFDFRGARVAADRFNRRKAPAGPGSGRE